MFLYVSGPTVYFSKIFNFPKYFRFHITQNTHDKIARSFFQLIFGWYFDLKINLLIKSYFSILSRILFRTFANQYCVFARSVFIVCNLKWIRPTAIRVWKNISFFFTKSNQPGRIRWNSPIFLWRSNHRKPHLRAEH